MSIIKKVKVALIGHGHLGKWHAQKANELEASHLYAIVDPNSKNRELAKLAHPNCKVVKDLSEVLNEIDAALVVTPTSTHFDICKKLLEHNKHIFCEKPLASNFFEASKLLDLASNTNSVFQVGHSERFHQIWKERDRFLQFFEEDSVVTIERCAPFKGRATDVSVVSDLMIHDLDLLSFLFNQKPIWVKSNGYKIRTAHWDFSQTQIGYNSNHTALIINSRNDVVEKRMLTIVNKNGTICFDLLNSKVYLADSNEKDSSSSYVTVEEYPKRDHLYLEQEYFYNSIINKSEAIVTLEDGINVVKLLDKVSESLENPGTPIKIES